MKEAPLWRFALRLWRDKRIERVCLRLGRARRAGGGVAHRALAQRSRAPAGPDLGRRLLAYAEQFEADYLRPLRAVRRRAADGQGTMELKRQIQEAELEGERLLLEQLSRQAQAQPGGQSVSALSWLFVVVPEAGQCESLEAGLEELAALSESLAVSE